MNTRIKRVTFDPRKGNKFRSHIDGIPQPGKDGLVTRTGALELISRLAGSGVTVVVGPKVQKPYSHRPERSQKKYGNGKKHR
jgi:hypothetical protein